MEHAEVRACPEGLYVSQASGTCSDNQSPLSLHGLPIRRLPDERFLLEQSQARSPGTKQHPSDFS